MYQKINGNDKVIVSHIADIDGMGSVCLANAVFGDIDVILVEVPELRKALEVVQNKNYKKIFITDLAFRDDSINLVMNDETLKEKIIHFDHHTSEVSNNMHSFINAIPVKDGIKTCGTTLFCEYLKEFYPSPVLETKYTKEFIELVRSYDTWDWKEENNTKARDLTTLFTIMGYEEFIKKYSKEILNNKEHFSFNETEQLVIRNKDIDIEEYISQCDKNLIRMNLMGRNVGVSISENYRSDVGNRLSEKHKDELEFILIVNFMRNSFSLRTVRDDIDLGKLAKIISSKAGGQKKAAGMPIEKDTIWILEKINKAIVKNEEQDIIAKSLVLKKTNK
ncbi:MAG: hypothetical protein PHW32_01950 [Bacilli bacterium]|nr:hypothetical protein [Bacilli bacterium]MDD4282780.1 hypothetical protein [Bacilli bacterium]MDD4718344.1 hypothetical protein [Bacilli bacterium]